MCGIAFVLSRHCGSCESSHLILALRAALRRRGPDSDSVVACGTNSNLIASVLAMRGSASVPQPVTVGTLCVAFNGEIFGGPLASTRGDTSELAAALAAALDTAPWSADAAAAAVCAVAAKIIGPFSFLAYDASRDVLFAARDAQGRRSLLYSLPSHPSAPFVFSSVAPDDGGAETALDWAEVPPSGVYYLARKESGAAAPTVWEQAGEEDGSWRLALSPWPAGGAASQRLARSLVSESGGAGAVDGVAAGGPESTLLEALRAAVSVRVSEKAAALSRAHDASQETGARVAVLFSGGLDSAVLAALAADALPDGEPLDLLSICFLDGASPDRAAALDCAAELRASRPSRTFNFISIDASYSAARANAAAILRTLSPAATHLDFNLGVALSSVARGEGKLVGSGARVRSSARALISGLGADELLGGYVRHRTAFQRGGNAALVSELEADCARLWLRNCGRDDRAVAAQGKEARWPFLDENVCAVIAALPLSDIVDFSLPAGEGDKRILRNIARGLGIPRTAARVKRAMHFGSGVAKLSNKIAGRANADTLYVVDAHVNEESGSEPSEVFSR